MRQHGHGNYRIHVYRYKKKWYDWLVFPSGEFIYSFKITLDGKTVYKSGRDCTTEEVAWGAAQYQVREFMSADEPELEDGLVGTRTFPYPEA